MCLLYFYVLYDEQLQSNEISYQKTGLTVVTNSLLDENDIVRTTAGCERSTRKRRDAYGKCLLDKLACLTY
jgi:hypothetical protein